MSWFHAAQVRKAEANRSFSYKHARSFGDKTIKTFPTALGGEGRGEQGRTGPRPGLPQLLLCGREGQPSGGHRHHWEVTERASPVSTVTGKGSVWGRFLSSSTQSGPASRLAW